MRLEGLRKSEFPVNFLWLIDGGVEQGLECPLTPPQSSPKIQDTPAEFEEFCRGASLASVFGDLVISENDPIFPKVSFDMIVYELSGPADPHLSKNCRENSSFGHLGGLRPNSLVNGFWL